MELKPLAHSLTICKVAEITGIDLNRDFYFLSKTDEEISLVCNTEDTPREVLARDDGWRAFRIQGILDFSLVGVLSKISSILSVHEIGIFVVSTYNTDYILVKERDFEKALEVLSDQGYTVV